MTVWVSIGGTSLSQKKAARQAKHRLASMWQIILEMKACNSKGVTPGWTKSPEGVRNCYANVVQAHENAMIELRLCRLSMFLR